MVDVGPDNDINLKIYKTLAKRIYFKFTYSDLLLNFLKRLNEFLLNIINKIVSTFYIHIIK